MVMKYENNKNTCRKPDETVDLPTTRIQTSYLLYTLW